MAVSRKVCALIGLWLIPAVAYAAPLSAVRKVTVTGQNPLQVQIQTNSKIAPQTQMITAPDRLVIDIPNSAPGPALRSLSLNRDLVKGIRVSQFSVVPPVTRVVVDLTAPQTYNVAPNATGWLVVLGSKSTATMTPAESQTATIGWVSAKGPVKVISTVASSTTSRSLLRPSIPANSVSVQFADGMLTIQATGATLSEVLFEIQKQTGAEIAIPAGAEQDRVAATFGPGPAGQVLGDLLNGSGLNFVVVGSESDPHVLRSLLLSRKSEQMSASSGIAQGYAAPEAENTSTENREDLTPPDSNPAPSDDNAPSTQPPADGAAQPPAQ